MFIDDNILGVLFPHISILILIVTNNVMDITIYVLCFMFFKEVFFVFVFLRINFIISRYFHGLIYGEQKEQELCSLRISA